MPPHNSETVSNTAAVTFAIGTVHNPDEPRHFMKVKPVTRRIRVIRDGAVLADTTEAVRVLEVGYDMYDPAIYFPKHSLMVEFGASDNTTICPLKGQASYLSIPGEGGRDVAWTYEKPYDFASAIAGYVSFYTDRVTIEEAPL